MATRNIYIKKADEMLKRYYIDLLRRFSLEAELYAAKIKGDINAQQYNDNGGRVANSYNDRVLNYVSHIMELEKKIEAIKERNAITGKYIEHLKSKKTEQAEKHLEFIRLYYMEQRRIKEIALLQGRSRQAVYKTLQSVRALFGRYLRKYL